MSKCRTGCPTQDHASWGECARAANMKIAYANSASGHDFTRQKRWDSELDYYKRARAQGIQPEGTTRDAVDRAVRFSDALGRPYNAETMPPTKVLKNESTAALASEAGLL